MSEATRCSSKWFDRSNALFYHFKGSKLEKIPTLFYLLILFKAVRRILLPNLLATTHLTNSLCLSLLFLNSDAIILPNLLKAMSAATLTH
jgi:hypothetical protein